MRLCGGLQLNLKLPALHAQALHRFGDGRSQFGRCLLARLGNLARLCHKCCLGLLRLRQQVGAVGSGLELRQFVFPCSVRGG